MTSEIIIIISNKNHDARSVVIRPYHWLGPSGRKEEAGTQTVKKQAKVKGGGGRIVRMHPTY